MTRAKLLLAAKLGPEDLFLPVSIVQPTVPVLAEGLAKNVIEKGLGHIALHHLGEAVISVLDEAPPNFWLQGNRGGIGHA